MDTTVSRVAVSGASGLVGRALAAGLRKREIEVVRLVRRREQCGADAAFWDPASGELDEAAIGRVDAIVHLAGENVGARRWNDEVRAKIRASRVNGTTLLAKAAKRLGASTIVSASGVGYYGDCGEEIVGESHAPGSTFIAEVAVAWEASLDPAREDGVRCVPLRIAPVVDEASDVIAKMVRPFKMFVGGKLGDGAQWQTFVALEDLVRIIEHALEDTTLTSAINAVSPEPIRNRDLTATLARILHRPAIFSVPGFAVRLAIGDLAGEVLASCRAVPQALAERGFSFAYPTIEAMLRHALSLPSE